MPGAAAPAGPQGPRPCPPRWGDGAPEPAILVEDPCSSIRAGLPPGGPRQAAAAGGGDGGSGAVRMLHSYESYSALFGGLLLAQLFLELLFGVVVLSRLAAGLLRPAGSSLWEQAGAAPAGICAGLLVAQALLHATYYLAGVWALATRSPKAFGYCVWLSYASAGLVLLLAYIHRLMLAVLGLRWVAGVCAASLREVCAAVLLLPLAPAQRPHQPLPGFWHRAFGTRW